MSKPPKPPGSDYEVGHGKPPKHTRFQKGQSGNPGGKKKGTSNVATVLEKIMASEIIVTESGKPGLKPALEALLLRHLQEGLKGSFRSRKDILDRCERYNPPVPQREDERSDEDQILIDRALRSRRRLDETGDGEGPTGPDEVDSDPDEEPDHV